MHVREQELHSTQAISTCGPDTGTGARRERAGERSTGMPLAFVSGQSPFEEATEDELTPGSSSEKDDRPRNHGTPVLSCKKLDMGSKGCVTMHEADSVPRKWR